jgi:hypothetical protein
MQSLGNFIEGKPKLIIKREKSKVCQSNQTKFLGYTIQKYGTLTIPSKSIERLKGKVRNITRRNRGRSFPQVLTELSTALRGWLSCFRHVKCHKLLKSRDGWIRRKLRCYRLKHYKRTYTLQQFLESLGVQTWQSWILALSGKGL